MTNNELKDNLRKIRDEEKYKAVYAKIDELQGKLVKERKKNFDMKRDLELMTKKAQKADKYQK